MRERQSGRGKSLLFLMPLKPKLHFAKYKKYLSVIPYMIFKIFFLLARRALGQHFAQKQTLKQKLDPYFVSCNKSTAASTDYLLFFSSRPASKSVIQALNHPSIFSLITSFFLCRHCILHSPNFLSQTHRLERTYTFQTLSDDYVVTLVIPVSCMQWSLLMVTFQHCPLMHIMKCKWG